MIGRNLSSGGSKGRPHPQEPLLAKRVFAASASAVNINNSDYQASMFSH
jgi:hypothetical protein